MDDAVFIPVSRGRALTRFVLWSVPTAICVAITFTAYPALDYSSPAPSNRLVTISLFIALLPAPIAGLVCGIKALRYLLLTLWPGRAGVEAGARSLVLRFGPFGRKCYDTARLEVRYPFELSADEEGASFEALLPEQKQFEQFLPRMMHPNSAEPISRMILRHCVGDEVSLAGKLRPVTEHWRSQGSSRPSPGESPQERRSC